MSKPIIIIGLDGATFDLILPWIKSGKLPFLREIMKNGAYGELLSTIPILSPAAW
ncbi:alkaline phosphatase family protein, partial [Candidatus Bathyarchaeota archaeon]|nr:alkaline phosphatase family protein [Candidatus Bathyarchaeota archaeon]